MTSALVVDGVPVECINHAAVQYHVPAQLIVSVLSIERGKIGDANSNKNGTYDYGPMQINSVWADKLKPYGISREAIQYDPCVNVSVGTWILAQHLAEAEDIWKGVGHYHSLTSHLSEPYSFRVQDYYQRMTYFLSHA